MGNGIEIWTDEVNEKLIDTRWVALDGRWETMVFPIKNGKPDYKNPIDVDHYETRDAALKGQADMFNKHNIHYQRKWVK